MAIDNFYAHELFGDLTPDGRQMDAIGPTERINLSKAMLVVAAADGELSPRELEYFIGMSVAMGHPLAAIEELRRFDARNARLEDYLAPEHKNFVRGFLYGAIKTAQVDGYHAKERTAARKAAMLLGVDEHVVEAIERLLDTEAAVRQMRISLLNPSDTGR